MTTELIRDCPFCGNTDYRVAPAVEQQAEFFTVVCMACNAEGPPAESESEALRLWNSRPEYERIESSCIR